MDPQRPTRRSRFRSFVVRHRFAIRDLSLIAAAALVGGYVLFAIDLFRHENGMTAAEAVIELDEALLLGSFVAVALLVFSWAQFRRQGREIALRRAAERHARELAYQDGLTGLPNRRQFEEALTTALGAPPRAGACHALLLLDLNGFKQVNDVYGHGRGDDVLIMVAQRLRQAVRDGDMVARLGGDEFAVVSTHLAGAEAATSIALRIIDGLEPAIQLGDTAHRVGAAIGIALLPQDAATSEEAIRKADVALYRAKTERRSAMRFFEEEMDAQVRERDALIHALRAAIEADAIHPLFVPTVHLATRTVTNFEVSPRWINEAGAVVEPERFIPIAEDTGLIHALAENMLRKACAAAATWPDHVRLAMDIYPSQLRDELLAARIVRILHEAGVAPRRLELEITESALVADIDAAQRTLGDLRGAGVRIVLDNFGTGYSSLYHLRSVRLDKVKVDRSFIEGMATDTREEGIVRALVGLGRGLGLEVGVEGLSDTEQGASLLRTGADEGQGHLFSGPMTAAEALAWVSDENGGAPDARPALRAPTRSSSSVPRQS
jgi:diguanylate cyclase (GGDEF)-like protein